MNHLLEADAMTLVTTLPKAMKALNNWKLKDPLSELTLAQKRMLKVVYEGSSSTSSIGDQLGMTVSAATQIIKKLVKMGLLQHSIDPVDKRHKPVSLTELGLELLNRRFNMQVARAQQCLTLLSPQERSQLLESVEILARAAKKLSPDLTVVYPEPAAEVSL